MEKTVTITQEEYNHLLEQECWVESLEAAGLDNWQGYEFACQIFKDSWGEDD